MFQNGYPSRRRSLVDDARFETLVVKQTKQSVLEEARARANGKSTTNFIEFACSMVYKTQKTPASLGVQYKLESVSNPRCGK